MCPGAVRGRAWDPTAQRAGPPGGAGRHRRRGVLPREGRDAVAVAAEGRPGRSRRGVLAPLGGTLAAPLGVLDRPGPAGLPLTAASAPGARSSCSPAPVAAREGVRVASCVERGVESRGWRGRGLRHGLGREGLGGRRRSGQHPHVRGGPLCGAPRGAARGGLPAPASSELLAWASPGPGPLEPFAGSGPAGRSPLPGCVAAACVDSGGFGEQAPQPAASLRGAVLSLGATRGREQLHFSALAAVRVGLPSVGCVFVKVRPVRIG